MISEIRDARVLVIGLGISGRSAARFCHDEGARVVASDSRPDLPRGDLPEGVELQLGALPDPADFDLVVPSPGVPLARYAARARRVWGDLELTWRALSVPVIAVTGTNGKSTTTLLLEAMLRAAGLRARAAGNVGVAALELVGQPLDVAVLEVSSFQLEAVEDFRPRVAALLNLSPDHLDRHGSVEAYAAAKARLFARQESDDAAVVNADDPAALACAADAASRPFRFSLTTPQSHGAWLDAGAARVGAGDVQTRVALDGMQLQGLQNTENALAALACCAAFGADVDKAAQALASFPGLPHRCEWVGTRADVRYVNDSKATNVGAALRSLAAFRERLVWIAGGKDKGLDFAPLAEVAGERARAAVLIGETAEALAGVLEGHLPCERAASMAEAVASAARLAQPGDVVLLAPACASFDMFDSYGHRGDCFREAVAGLSGETR